jgi:EAL domain-containing protein (putative c-di-GMP-specific phosphodiesterase class I)
MSAGDPRSGVRVAIDNFGASYVSLANIQLSDQHPEG